MLFEMVKDLSEKVDQLMKEDTEGNDQTGETP